MIGEPIPHALKQAIHAEQIQWGGQPIKSARAIDFYLFYHIHEQNAFIVGKEEPLTMPLSTKHFLSLHVICHSPQREPSNIPAIKKDWLSPVFFVQKASDYLEYSSTMLVSLTSSLYGSSSLCGKRTRVAVQLSKDFSMYGRSKVLASWKDCLNISLDL